MDFTPTYARRPTAKDEGTGWLYVLPGKNSQHRVEIDVVPDKAKKVRIQHLDRDMRGSSEWVPIGRLKVPWSSKADYDATCEVWDRLEQYAPPGAHADAAMLLLDAYLEPSVAGIYYNGAGGVLEIHDPEALAKACGAPVSEILGHEDTFVDQATYVPWPITLRVLEGLCRIEPRPALELFAQQRARQEEHAAQVLERGEPWWVSEAEQGQIDAKRIRRWHDQSIELHDFLQELIGERSPSLADDFLTLRDMYADLVRLMPAAVQRIRMVRAKKSNDMAEEIERLVSRPLPRSAEILGAEPRPE